MNRLGADGLPDRAIPLGRTETDHVLLAGDSQYSRSRKPLQWLKSTRPNPSFG